MQGNHYSPARHELKYIIDEATADSVRNFVCAHLSADPHSNGDGYPVSSIYLDSPSYELYSQTARGQRNRFKLRVRYYDENEKSPVFFEIKRRAGAVIQKRRSAVFRESAAKILKGATPNLADLPPRSGDIASLNEFRRLQLGIGAYGFTYVGYKREAFSANSSLSELRVTFDRKLVAGKYQPDQPFRILPPDISPSVGGVILELKFTDRFPRWMHDLVRTFNLERTSVPKYNTCVDALGAPVLSNELP